MLYFTVGCIQIWLHCTLEHPNLVGVCRSSVYRAIYTFEKKHCELSYFSLKIMYFLKLESRNKISTTENIQWKYEIFPLSLLIYKPDKCAQAFFVTQFSPLIKRSTCISRNQEKKWFVLFLKISCWTVTLIHFSKSHRQLGIWC